MTAVPTVPTFAAGVSSVALLNQLGAAVAFAMDPPSAQLRQTSSQPISSGASWTAVAFSVADSDSNPVGTPQWSGSHPTRFVAVYPGRYLALGAGAFDGSNTDGDRGCRLAMNGSAVEGTGALYAPTDTAVQTAVLPPAEVFLDTGDYLELQIFQSSGADMDTSDAPTGQSYLTVIFVKTATA